jgi:hypothetical protein
MQRRAFDACYHDSLLHHTHTLPLHVGEEDNATFQVLVAAVGDVAYVLC